MTRAIHATAIILLVLAPLASVIGWQFVVGAVCGVVLYAGCCAVISLVSDFVDGLEAERL